MASDLNSTKIDSEHPEIPAKQRNFLRRLLMPIGTIEVWVVLALIFTIVMRLSNPDAENSSDLWFLDPLVMVIFLLMLFVNRQFHVQEKLRLPPVLAAVGFVVISWTMSMLYELSIASGGIGTYGGMYPKTIPSFIIAQGHYVPLALLGFWLVRRYHITSYELFFVAGMTALYEAITVGGPVLLSPLFVLSPIVIAYYFVVYSIFLSMGLQLIDARLFWDNTDRHISFGRKILYGAILGIFCWVTFVLWGEVMTSLFDGFKSF